MEEKNLDAMAANITKTFKGVEIKGVIPKVNGGWSYGIGLDTYGGKIFYVSPDLSWFIGDGMCGFAKLDTRKNSCHFGKYVHSIYAGISHFAENLILHPESFDDCFKEVYKHLKPEPTCHSRGCLNHNVRRVSENPQKDHLDPSF